MRSQDAERYLYILIRRTGSHVIFLLSGSCKFLEVFSKYNKQIAKHKYGLAYEFPLITAEIGVSWIIKFLIQERISATSRRNYCG